MKHRLLWCLVILVMPFPCIAGTWQGAVTTKFQVDNRITNETTFLGEVWSELEYFNKDYDLRAGFNFIIRGSDLNRKTDFEFGDDNGFKAYQAFLEKAFPALNMVVTGGRFERADNLGFYLLDGAGIQYRTPNRLFSIDVYGGVPSRYDDLKVVRGQSLYGFDSVLHLAPGWKSQYSPLTLELIDLRLGLQRFRDDTVAERFTFAINTEGLLMFGLGDQFEARVLGTYRFDQGLMEDILAELQYDFNEDIRVRMSYEDYDPERIDDPTFRERFYNLHSLGGQKLFRGSVDYQLNHALRLTLGGLQSTREIGDPGWGIDAGVLAEYWPGVQISVLADYVKLGRKRIISGLFGVESSITSQLNLQVDAIVRQEKKLIYGENLVLGAEVICDYMLQNDLVLSLDVNYIVNSRLENEYLGRIQSTYYFDYFQTKDR